MSAQAPVRRITAPQIAARKGGTPIVALTAYTAPMAVRVDPHAEVILVGDSLGMVVHGLPSTIGVTTEMMILHGQAVKRSSQQAMVVIDLPFGSYEESPQQASRNAAQIMGETGCGAVKLEGGSRMAPTIRFLTERGVPVMGHVGLTPQATHGRLQDPGTGNRKLARLSAGCG
jgi:3-methyl-2-oxobutanoate hydroxymethyltransferase